jgi:hypothetical protein
MSEAAVKPMSNPDEYGADSIKVLKGVGRRPQASGYVYRRYG